MNDFHEFNLSGERMPQIHQQAWQTLKEKTGGQILAVYVPQECAFVFYEQDAFDVSMAAATYLAGKRGSIYQDSNFPAVLIIPQGMLQGVASQVAEHRLAMMVLMPCQMEGDES